MPSYKKGVGYSSENHRGTNMVISTSTDYLVFAKDVYVRIMPISVLVVTNLRTYAHVS